MKAHAQITFNISYFEDSELALARYVLNQTLRRLRDELEDITGFKVHTFVAVTPEAPEVTS